MASLLLLSSKVEGLHNTRKAGQMPTSAPTKPPSDEGGGFAVGEDRGREFSPPVRNQSFLPAPSSEGAKANTHFLLVKCPKMW